MERWASKLAVVSGASSGIGAGICVELVKSGMIVVGLARRVEKIEDLKSEIPEKLRDNLHALKCDVSKEDEIIEVFKQIETQFGAVFVMINNAGIATVSDLLAIGDSQISKNIIDVNVFGLVNCTREAYKSMNKHGINDGHIININSIIGHQVINMLHLEHNKYNIYSASKYAVTSLTETYRQDFIKRNTKIRVTSISPGVVKTDLFPEDMRSWLDVTPHLFPKDIADAVVYVLGTPPHVQIHELTIKPVGEKF